jgi:hypothetical protein
VDRLIVPETARTMAERIPAARTVRLENEPATCRFFERDDRLAAELGAFAERALTGALQQAVRAGHPE